MLLLLNRFVVQSAHFSLHPTIIFEFFSFHLTFIVLLAKLLLDSKEIWNYMPYICCIIIFLIYNHTKPIFGFGRQDYWGWGGGVHFLHFLPAAVLLSLTFFYFWSCHILLFKENMQLLWLSTWDNQLVFQITSSF